MKRQRNSYTVKEKHKAVELAHRTSNKFVAETYFLDLTMLGRWIKSFLQDNLFNKNSQSIGSGHHALFSEEEAQLYKWIIELHKEDLAVNYSSIKMKIAEIMKLSAGLAQDETKKLAINNFKFSQHWLSHYLKWYNLSLCRKTKITQKLLVDLEDKLLKFQQFVIHLHQKNDYPLGNNKNRFTIVLTCLANGTKLLSVIIFKRKVWPAHTPPPPADIVVWFQDKEAMLVLDSFSAHILDQTKLALSSDHLIYENNSENSEDAEFVNNSDEIEIDNKYESTN
ncbi:414_t:CDS:2, partial [Gigaspora margarita]